MKSLAESSNILSIHTQQPLLLSILITLNNLINMFQNLFLPPHRQLLILESFFLTSSLYSSSRFLSPRLIILASDKSLLLFLCQPGVIAIAEDVRVLARVAGYQGPGDVGVVEQRVPERFDEFGLVEFEVAEAFYAVGL
jgi:hypothetical protein